MRALTLALALAGCATAPEPRMASPTPAVTERPTPSYEQAMAWRLPAGVSFALSGPPALEGGQVVVRGVLRNASDQPAEVIVFPSGSGGALHAQLRTGPEVDYWRDDDPGRPDLPPRGPPPAPPPPQAFVLAPHAEQAYLAPIDLRLFKYQGEPEVEVEWTFLFWNEPKPRGQARLRLPRR